MEPKESARSSANTKLAKEAAKQKLEELRELRASGSIDEKEYKRRKQQLKDARLRTVSATTPAADEPVPVAVQGTVNDTPSAVKSLHRGSDGSNASAGGEGDRVVKGSKWRTKQAGKYLQHEELRFEEPLVESQPSSPMSPARQHRKPDTQTSEADQQLTSDAGSNASARKRHVNSRRFTQEREVFANSAAAQWVVDDMEEELEELDDAPPSPVGSATRSRAASQAAMSHDFDRINFDLVGDDDVRRVAAESDRSDEADPGRVAKGSKWRTKQCGKYLQHEENVRFESDVLLASQPSSPISPARRKKIATDSPMSPARRVQINAIESPPGSPSSQGRQMNNAHNAVDGLDWRPGNMTCDAEIDWYEEDSSDFDDEDFSQYRSPGGTKAFVQPVARNEVLTNAPSVVQQTEVDVAALPTPQQELEPQLDVGAPAESSHESIPSTPMRQFEEDIPSKLRQLKELFDQGIINEKDFETKKQELLSRM